MQTALELPPQAEPNAACERATPVVIVGAGPVGVRALRELRRVDTQLPVVLYGDEAYEPYNRVKLSGLLSGQHKLAELSLAADLVASQCPHTRLRRRRVMAIDPAGRAVIDAAGERQPYSALILATGSRPFVPNLAGAGLRGVFTFRDMADAEKLAARRVQTQHTVVLGAGLLGVEAACAMQRHNTRVTLIDHNPHPMCRQLDATAGAILAEELEARGITLRMGSSIRMILGTGSVQGVILRSGEELPCDTVILATGIVPNRDLAQAAGLAHGRGVTVNERMQTSDPHIYAVGECCEFNGEVFGIVAPGFEQAAIAARRVTGADGAAYQRPQLATSLKVAGLPVFGLGVAQPPVSMVTHTWRDGDDYRRVSLAGGHIVSMNAVGDWDELPLLRDYSSARKWISPLKLWRFRRTGRFTPADAASNVAAWPAAAIVCNCNSVSCGELRSAVAQGADSLPALASRTQAGSGCGSCQPLLQELLGDSGPRRPAPVAGVLAACSVVAAIGLLLALAGSVAYPDTVQLGWRFDMLWRDNLLKQVSGYSVVGLSVVSLLFSLRKRLPKLSFGRFEGWRLSHVLLTLAALLALAVHTGFRFGDNLNLLLMATFLALVGAGAALGLSIALEHRMAPALARRMRALGLWGHVLLFWPLPALLGAHIFKTYYF